MTLIRFMIHYGTMAKGPFKKGLIFFGNIIPDLITESSDPAGRLSILSFWLEAKPTDEPADHLLILKFFENQCRIVPSKSKCIIHCIGNIPLHRLIGCIVQITLRVRGILVEDQKSTRLISSHVA